MVGGCLVEVSEDVCKVDVRGGRSRIQLRRVLEELLRTLELPLERESDTALHEHACLRAGLGGESVRVRAGGAAGCGFVVVEGAADIAVKFVVKCIVRTSSATII